MTILHVIDSGGLYGAEVMLLSLMREQASMGMLPILASIGEHGIKEKAIEREARRCGIRVEPFRMRAGPNLSGIASILGFVRRERVDILHSHGYKPNILFGFIPRKIRGCPMVATLHGWTSAGRFNKMGLYEWLDSVSLGLIDQVVLVNEAMREQSRLKNRFGPHLMVINNGIPPVDVESPFTVTFPDGPSDSHIVDFCSKGFTLGAIGRLSPEKGFDLLLGAVKTLIPFIPDVRLLILGEGGERATLEWIIRKQGLQGRVLLPGYVPDARIYLNLFDVFVLPSHTEGLPLVILEAMQAGVPIVATRVGGVPNVLQNGKLGILVEPSDISALTEGLLKLKSNPALRFQLADMARGVVKELYSSNRMADQYRLLYRALLNLDK
ncbi:glycoside hydrolase [Geobacter sulfurreducens]|nr:glycoside hydrolase [Geobacter sulfurreducens]